MARATDEIKPGVVLGGKYRIERVIGQGGMGVVVAARHTDLQQRVAIKLLLSEHASDADLVERFMREARAVARLKSEHAVKVIDVGTRSSGSPYLVMELLDGQDLGELVERGALPISEAVDFVLQACEAIAEAHALGIVHRDLKPRNLFLAKTLNGRPLVKVLDFGLAKRIDMQDRALTATATVMGSPQYMSPEQMKASRDVDLRTDIWSLGVCLYELMTGRVPFDSPAIPVLCAMVLKDDPTAIRTFRPDVPEALWGVLQTCLMKEPSRRYTSISDLAAALEPFSGVHSRGAAQRIAAVLATVQRPVSDAPPSLRGGHDTEPTTQVGGTTLSTSQQARNRVWWVASVVFVTTLIVALGGAFALRGEASARAPRDRSRYEPEIATLTSPQLSARPRLSDPTGGKVHTVKPSTARPPEDPASKF